jgi:carbon monoxide dehydrogenase subunit G
VKINGTARLSAPRESVWAALNDPAVLVRTIPGCEQLEALGEDRYRMTVTAGVASIKGTYLGEVALTDPEPVTAFTLRASGSGAPGTVQADVRVTLDDADGGGTLLSYAADAVVGGAVGGVGQRVLAGVAKKTAGEFFKAVDAALAEPAAPNGVPVPVPGQAGSPRAEAADGAPTVDEVREAVLSGAPAAPQTVFTRRGPGGGGAGRQVHVDVRNQLPGVLVGAAIALIGVWLGARLGRRR